MQKRVAILTQPLRNNYGGSVQNFALTTFLRKQGYYVETINRVEANPNSPVKVSISKYKKQVQKFLGRNVLTEKDQEIIISNHTSFLQNEINLSPRITNNEELIQYVKNKAFDIIIVGSDQTWRPKYSPNIYNYFLDFTESNDNLKKIAYASSFGTDEWEFTLDQTEICQRLAKKFDALSVRESSGVELCRKFLKVDAIEVLDPTLLLSKEDYIQIFPCNVLPRKGVFTYILDTLDYKSKMIESVCGMLTLQSFTNQPKNLTSAKIEDRVYPSVYGWLQAFHDAYFIVTDSFHGTVFSIIFNKPFVTIINKERGASRFYSLLEKFDLTDRIINEETQDLKSIIFKPIDYDGVNEKINLLRKESANFLLANLLK